MVTIRVYHECSKVMWSIVGSQTGLPVVGASVGNGRLVKLGDSSLISGGECQVKAGCRRTVPFWGEFNRKLIATTGDTVAHGLTCFSGPDILPNADVAERSKGSIIECR